MPYSERAAKAYKDAEFHVVKDGGHGFQGETFEQAMGFIDGYLEKNRDTSGQRSRQRPLGS